MKKKKSSHLRRISEVLKMDSLNEERRIWLEKCEILDAVEGIRNSGVRRLKTAMIVLDERNCWVCGSRNILFPNTKSLMRDDAVCLDCGHNWLSW